MKEFKIVPKIVSLDTPAELAEKYVIGHEDLVICGETVWNRYFDSCAAGQVVFVRRYGSGEPTDEMVKKICTDIKLKFRRVIAIGGGTVIDIAKLFALDVSDRLDILLDDLFDGKCAARRDKELIIVPTTCGTGSEVTNISILEFKARGTKLGLAADALYADEAVLLPRLLEDMPPKVFAASSIDALVHSIESYLSPKATEISAMFSEKAMKSILYGYRKLAEGEKTDFGQFLRASAYAGIAFGNAGCAAVHALSYPLGAVFHVPHGEANYAMLTGVLKAYEKSDSGEGLMRLKKIIAEILDCPTENALDELEELLDNAVLKKKALHEYGMCGDRAAEFAESVLKNQQRLLSNNYAELSRERIEKIYRDLM